MQHMDIKPNVMQHAPADVMQMVDLALMARITDLTSIKLRVS
jgi:hypothetical protein